jgi:hypothetical protein
MRFPHNGYITDKYGNVVTGCTVNVYLAGTTTPVSIYETSTSVDALNSVITDEYGRFTFWVDDTEYTFQQLFKITTSSGYDTITYDNIPIIISTIAIDTDANLSANSDLLVASQKATKAYADSLAFSAGSGNVIGDSSSTDGNITLFEGITGKVIKDSLISISTDNTFASDSDLLVPTEKATKHYITDTVTGLISDYALNTVEVNGQPLTGDVTITLAGLGGVADTVEINGHALSGNIDITCSDITAVAGTLSTETDLDDGAGASDSLVPSQLAVKTYIDNAVTASSSGVTGPVSSVDGDITLFNGVTGAIIKDSGIKTSTDGTLSGNSDTLIPTQKAVKTYADTMVTKTTTVNGHALSGNISVTTTDLSLQNAISGPASNTDLYIPQWDGTDSKLIKNGVMLDTNTGLVGNSDTRIATQKATKTYVDTSIAAISSPEVNINATQLKVITSSVTQLTITADEIILETAARATKRVYGVSETVAITTSGTNGLDTGSEAVSTWYYVYIINNGTTTNALLSASTSPTLPSGYTYKALVSTVYNNSSGNFVSYVQYNKNIYYNSASTILSGAYNTVYTSIALGIYVPPNAIAAKIKTQIWTTSGGVSGYVSFDGTNDYFFDYTLATSNSSQNLSVPLLTAQTIWNKVVTGSNGVREMNIYCMGYELP